MTPPLPSDFLGAPLAHRGLHSARDGVVENSLGAVAAAVEAGFGIEIDVQLTSDGTAMVFHDDTLERLTRQSGPIRGWASRDLRKLRLVGATETIPTLGEVLDVVAGKVPLLIELKDQSGGKGQAPDDLEQAVADALHNYGGPVAVMSFNPHMVAASARRAPNVPRGLTTDGYAAKDWPDLAPAARDVLQKIATFDQVEASFISHNWRDLSAPRVGQLKDKGVPILCWTVKSQADEVAARRIADNITFEGYDPTARD